MFCKGLLITTEDCFGVGTPGTAKTLMRLFYTIDGNPVIPNRIVGYCKSKDGCMTKRLIDTHKCREKGCKGLICFRFTDGDTHEKRGSSRRNESVGV